MSPLLDHSGGAGLPAPLRMLSGKEARAETRDHEGTIRMQAEAGLA